MLKDNLFPTVQAWINSLTNNTDLMIRPYSGTPLNRLTSAGLSMEAIASTTETTPDAVQACIQGCAERVTGGEFGNHQVILKEEITRYTQAMQAIVHRANTDVLPLIGQAVDAAQTAINEVREDFIAPVKVLPVKADELLRAPELELLMHGQSERPDFKEDSLNRVFAYLENLDKDQLKQLLLTNDPKLDGIVANKIEANTVSWLLFTPDEIKTISQPVDKGERDFTSTAKAMMFLAVTGILSGNLGEPSLELKRAAVDIRRFTEYGLQVQLDSAIKRIESGSILVGWYQEAYYVEERNYRNWLNKGGSIEAVIGYACNRKRLRLRPSDADFQNMSPEDLVAEYNRFLNTDKVNQSDRQSRAVTKAVASVIKDEMKRLNIEGGSIGLAEIMKRRPFTSDKQLDVYAFDTVMEALALESTQVGRFIRAKVEISRALPDAEPKDITAAAVMRLLAWSLASQIEMDTCSEKRSNAVTLSDYY